MYISDNQSIYFCFIYVSLRFKIIIKIIYVRFNTIQETMEYTPLPINVNLFTIIKSLQSNYKDIFFHVQSLKAYMVSFSFS